MAARSEEVFIHLQVTGAGESRRDIDNVSRALDRLDKKTGQHTDSLKENTKAQGSNNAQTARANQLNDSRAGTMGRVNRIHNDFNKTLKFNDTLEKKLTKTQDTYIRGLTRRSSAASTFDRTSDTLAKREVLRATRTERSLASIAEKGWKNQERLTKKYQKRISRITGGGGRGRSGFGGGGGGRRILGRGAGRVGLMGVLIGTAIEGIPLLATGLNALGAAGIAAANGLAPLVGILGALPAGLLALGSAGAVIGMAFGGLSKAIGGDAKAMALLGPNTQAFVQAIIDSKGPMNTLRRYVQETFMDGLGFEIRNLVVNYLPALHKHLGTIATDLNAAGKETIGWFSTKDGAGVMNNIFSNNENIISKWAVSGTQLLQLFLRIGSAAGPMLTAMSEDFMNFISGLNGAAAGNSGGLEGFFTGSYDRLKQVLGVLGDFGTGIYNIVRLADPLTSFLGTWITDLASGFSDWTASVGGQASITSYFEDMREPMRAIIDLAGKLAGGLFAIAQSDNFVKFMDKLSGENGLIDGLVKIFKNADTTFLDAWIIFFGAIEKFASGGGLEMLGNVAVQIANIFKTLVDVWSTLPPMLQQALVAAIVVGVVAPGAPGAIIGGIGRLGGGGAAAAGGGGVLAGGGLGAAATIAGGVAIPLMLTQMVNKALANWEGVNTAEQNANSILGGGVYNDDSKLNKDFKFGSSDLFNGLLFGSTPGAGTLGKSLGAQQNAKDLFASVGLGWVTDLQNARADLANSLGFKIGDTQLNEKFASADQALADLASGGNLPAAVQALRDIRDESGLTADQMYAKFPKMKAVFDLLAPGVDAFTSSVGTFNDNILAILTHLQTVNTQIGAQDFSGSGSTSGGPTVIPMNFAGGLVGAGTPSFVGELGPELAVSRNGGIGMVGLNGPQLIRPGHDLGILPNSALHGGGTGNAPDWAVKALNGGGLGSDNAARIAAAQSKQNAADQRPINIDVRVSNPSSNVDVTQAVVNAVREIEKDKRERK